MNVLTCNVKLPQWVTVTIAGLIGMVVAWSFGGDQFRSNFLLFLHVLSYYITPWVAVLIVDYYVVQQAGQKHPGVRQLLHPPARSGTSTPRDSPR